MTTYYSTNIIENENGITKIDTRNHYNGVGIPLRDGKVLEITVEEPNGNAYTRKYRVIINVINKNPLLRDKFETKHYLDLINLRNEEVRKEKEDREYVEAIILEKINKAKAKAETTGKNVIWDQLNIACGNFYNRWKYVKPNGQQGQFASHILHRNKPYHFEKGGRLPLPEVKRMLDDYYSE